MESRGLLRTTSTPVRLGQVILMSFLLLVSLLLILKTQPGFSSSPNRETCPGALHDTHIITIGVAVSYNEIPELGWPQRNAVKLALNQVNAAGGVDIEGVKYKVRSYVLDGGCGNPNVAITVANQMVAHGVLAVIGHTCSGASMEAQPIYANAGIPMISPSSTGPFVTEQGYTTTFRVISRDDAPAINLATKLRKWYRLDRAVTVAMTGTYASMYPGTFSSTFTNLGGTILANLVVTSTAEFTDTLVFVKHTTPGVIAYFDSDPKSAGQFSAIAVWTGMNDVQVAWIPMTEDVVNLDTYAAAAGNAADDDLASISFRNREDMPGFQDFNAAYQAMDFPNFGDEATEWAAFSYDAAMIVLDAIHRASSNNPIQVRDAIAATYDYKGVVGIYEGFDAQGDVIPQWTWIEQYKNGQWQKVIISSILLPVAFKGFGQ